MSTASPLLRFKIQAEGSVVTVRVREQLAGLPAPSEAVLSTSLVSGEIGLTRDGRIASGTSIRADLSALESDDPRRDGFVKQQTLDTQRYPIADIIVVGTYALPQPLPSSGEWKFTLVTAMTMHGATREVQWDVTGQRVGREIRASARASVRFADFDLQRPSVAAVLSVQDEINIEVLLRATQ